MQAGPGEIPRPLQFHQHPHLSGGQRCTSYRGPLGCVLRGLEPPERSPPAERTTEQIWNSHSPDPLKGNEDTVVSSQEVLCGP